MENLEITWQTLLVISAGLVTLLSAWNLLVKTFNPFRELKARVEKHDHLLDKDKNRIDAMESGQKVMLNGMLALLDSQITNDPERIKEARNQVHAYLVQK